MNIKNEKVNRIAIMGGTFNPIHYGHLVMAEAVRCHYNIDNILFIPSGHPPHKDNNEVLDKEHRFLMSVLATDSNPNFFVSRIELDREGVTYTIDTINQLVEIYGKDTKIYFIAGADVFNEILTTWKDPAQLFQKCTFIAATRPEYNKDELLESMNKIKKKYKANFHFIEVPALSISSTDIRNRVKEGKSIKYLVPETVENYIYKCHIYV